MSAVKESVERLIANANGEMGLLLLATPEGFSEHVLVRREDLELLLATWGEKRA